MLPGHQVLVAAEDRAGQDLQAQPSAREQLSDVSEHEEQIHTLRWLGMLPSGSSHPSGPGLRWRSHGQGVPALLPGVGAAGVPV